MNNRRRTDQGPLCWIAMRLSQMWDFIDARDIDKHAVCWAVLLGAWFIGTWSMDFARTETSRSGSDLALIIGAVTAPYTLMLTGVIKWYFESRDKT